MTFLYFLISSIVLASSANAGLPPEQKAFLSRAQGNYTLTQGDACKDVPEIYLYFDEKYPHAWIVTNPSENYVSSWLDFDYISEGEKYVNAFTKQVRSTFKKAILSSEYRECKMMPWNFIFPTCFLWHTRRQVELGNDTVHVRRRGEGSLPILGRRGAYSIDPIADVNCIYIKK